MKALLIITAVSCVSAAHGIAQEPVTSSRPELPGFQVIGEPATPEDGEAVSDLLRDFGAAWGDADAESVARFYHEDAEWTNAFGDVVRTSEGIQAFLTGLFGRFGQAPSESEETNFRPISLRYVGGDVAVYHGLTTSTRGQSRDGEGERRVHSTFVLAKEDGAWRIVHQMIMDARE